MEGDEQSQNRVAPVLNEQKKGVFLISVIETVLGFSFSESKTVSQKSASALFIVPSLFLWLFSMLVKNYLVGIIVATAVPSIMIITWLLVEHFLVDREQIKEDLALSQTFLAFRCGVLTIPSCFLASNHFLMSQDNVWLSIVSIITLLGSLSSLFSKPIRQYGAMTQNYHKIGLRSTFLVRLYICNVVLIIQSVLYYLGTMTQTVTVLQYVYCFLFVIWWGGFVSDLKSMSTILLNWVNQVVFGQQNKVGFKRGLISLFLNVGITLGFVVEYMPGNDNYFTLVNCVMSGMAMITSTSLVQSLCWFQKNVVVKANRHYLEFILEAISMAGKVILTVLIPPMNKQYLLIVLGVDIGVYLIVSLVLNLSQGRTFLGTTQMLKPLGPTMRTILRWLVHSSLDVCFVFLAKELYNSNHLNQYYFTFVYRILLYRSYKRSIYQPLSFGIHLSMGLSMALCNVIPMWIIPLSMVSLPDDPLLMLLAPFIIPKKNLHKYQGVYRVLYLIVTLIGLSVILVSAGLLQPLMIFGLPAFVWSLPLIKTPQPNGQGKDRSIHQHLVQHLNSVIEPLDVGTYLIRISKYLMLCRVVEKGIGYQIAQFRGLQAQEVTSCHGIQSQSIDNMVDNVWGDNKQCQLDHITSVLSPKFKSQYSLFQANEISLAGLVDSKEFGIQLRSNYIRSLVYLMHKHNYAVDHKSQLQKANCQVYDLLGKQQIDQMRPKEFCKQLGLPIQHNTLPHLDKQQSIKIKPHIPPKLIQPKKVIQMFDEFDFLMQKEPVTLPVENTQVGSINHKEESSTALIVGEETQSQTSNKRSIGVLESSLKHSRRMVDNPSPVQMAIMLCVYSLGKGGFIDQKKLYQLLRSTKSCEKVLKNVTLSPKGELCLRSIRYAFKLSVEQLISCQQQTSLEDIKSIDDKDFYIGVLGQSEFQEALVNKTDLIWSIDYKEGIKVNRYAQREVDLYLFKLDQTIVKGVWNNLRFQLLYVTNDDDERYSIQTHPGLLRNLLVQGAVEPLGYAPYYSGFQAL